MKLQAFMQHINQSPKKGHISLENAINKKSFSTIFCGQGFGDLNVITHMKSIH